MMSPFRFALVLRGKRPQRHLDAMLPLLLIELLTSDGRCLACDSTEEEAITVREENMALL